MAVSTAVAAEPEAIASDQAELVKFNRWERIDDYGRDAIAKRTRGEVLYIEGTFTASVYPMDYNNMTIEVPVAD